MYGFALLVSELEFMVENIGPAIFLVLSYNDDLRYSGPYFGSTPFFVGN